MMPDGIWVGFGGNQSGTEAALHEAIARISRVVPLQAVSSLYLTAPQNYRDQADFLNLVAQFSLPPQASQLAPNQSPASFLAFLLDLEMALGRDRLHQIAKGPRLIDLDLLLWGATLLDTAVLVLPHPSMHQRRFVLDPLLEINPRLRDPRSGRLYLDWQNTCLDQAIYSKRSLGYTDQSV